jgi:hypothetical protein
VKSPATAAKATKAKPAAAKKKAGAAPTTPYSPAAAAKSYLATSRSELAASRRQAAEARKQSAEAARSRGEAAALTAQAHAASKAGNQALAAADLARAQHDLARAGREAGRAKRDMARSKKNAVKAKANAVKARLVTLAQPGAVRDGWVLGGNDRHDGCAAVAVANSLLAATGYRASDDDVLDLYLAASGGSDTGASVLAVLEVAAEFGLCGMRLASFDPAMCSNWPGTTNRAAGFVVDLALEQAQRDQDVWDFEPSLPWGDHAVVLTGDTVVTWGREVPVTGAFLDAQVMGAWRVEWAAASQCP